MKAESHVSRRGSPFTPLILFSPDFCNVTPRFSFLFTPPLPPFHSLWIVFPSSLVVQAVLSLLISLIVPLSLCFSFLFFFLIAFCLTPLSYPFSPRWMQIMTQMEAPQMGFSCNYWWLSYKACLALRVCVFFFFFSFLKQSFFCPGPSSLSVLISLTLLSPDVFILAHSGNRLDLDPLQKNVHCFLPRVLLSALFFSLGLSVSFSLPVCFVFFPCSERERDIERERDG